MAASYRGAVEDKRSFHSHHFSNAYFQPNNPRGAGFILDKTKKPLKASEIPSKATQYVGESLIKVENIDLLKVVNEGQHNTSFYETPKVVLRRGNPFVCRLILSEEFDQNKHALVVEFREGTRPSFTTASRFESIIGQCSAHSWQWRGRIERIVEKSVDLRIEIPVDTPVAEYEVIGEAVDLGTHRRDSKTASRNAVVLFNPWNKGDEVYMEDEKEREEYVNSGTGRIWTGLSDEALSWPWAYEQFESYTLETVLYLLHKSGMDHELRRSPVHVSRVCTAMVNADEDGGVLQGNWSTDYSHGTPPTAWSGSGAILEEFWKTKKPVKWAQSWVFGGTLTSVLRCLGIPSRPITNFMSLQSPEGSLSTTAQLDVKTLSMTGAEMWNYHVWVEAWMERPDLKGAYGGWQAVDATPQPYNEQTKVFTIGPSPVSAVKQRKSLKYDSQFMSSVVSGAMKCTLSMKDRIVLFKTTTAGKAILTKALQTEDPVNILSSYKDEAVNDVQESDSISAESINFSIVPTSNMAVGQDVRFTMMVASSAAEEQVIEFWTRVSTASYTGTLGDVLISSTESRTLLPGAQIEVPFVVTPAEYMGKLTDQFYVNITANVTFKDNELPLSETLHLKPPVCLVTSEVKALKVGQNAKVKASFKNPLDMVLNGVEWYIEGSGLTRPMVIPKSPIQPGKEAVVEFEVTASNAAKPLRSVVVSFLSKELTGVKGMMTFSITKRDVETVADANTSS